MGNKASIATPRFVGIAPQLSYLKTGDVVFFGNQVGELGGSAIVWEHAGVVVRLPQLFAEHCETMLLEYADEYRERLDDFSCMHRATAGVRLVNLEARVRSASHAVIDVMHSTTAVGKSEVDVMAVLSELLPRAGDELGRTSAAQFAAMPYAASPPAATEMSPEILLAKFMSALQISEGQSLKNFTPQNLYRKINDVTCLQFHFDAPFRLKDARVF